MLQIKWADTIGIISAISFLLMNRALAAVAKEGFHPRNLHRTGYDFAALTRTHPALQPHIQRNKYNGEATIDFSNADAVLQLNAALLSHHYSVHSWGVPEGYLCPPIPSRADYIHHVADILIGSSDSKSSQQQQQQQQVRVMDIGTGANCIYPILGSTIYGWDFVAVDIDAVALQSAAAIINSNPNIYGKVEVRQQKNSSRIFSGVMRAGEVFDATMCNPPFHDSLAAAAKGSARKWRNLGTAAAAVAAGATAAGKHRSQRQDAPHLNFGGQSNELCCAGGEVGFLAKLVRESAHPAMQQRVNWFTTLVSKSDNVKAMQALLQEQPAVQAVKTITMQHGQKKSRIVAWSFHASP